MAGGHIDENLLGRLVTKYGLDRETNQRVRSRLWVKLTREYNDVTGSSHAKAKIAKKWQNVAFREKSRETVPQIQEEVKLQEAANVPAVKKPPPFRPKLPSTSVESVWAVMDFALRDLLVYLVDKHNLECISHPHLRSKVWGDVAREFHELAEVPGLRLKQERFAKKWQNWKAYNRLKRLPHPFQQCRGRLDYDVIRAKLRKVRERVVADPEFAAGLAAANQDLPQEPPHHQQLTPSHQQPQLHLEEDTLLNDESLAFAFQEEIAELEKEEGDYQLLLTGAAGEVMDRRSALRRLRAETDRHRNVVTAGQLERKKLSMEIDLVSTQLEQAKVELEMKKMELEKMKATACSSSNVTLHQATCESDLAVPVLP